MNRPPLLGEAAGDERLNVTVLIPAAGASRRLGRPKALVQRLDCQSLLAAAVGFARAAGLTPVVTVAADADDVRREAESTQARTIVVANPSPGLSVSIRAGVETLASDPDVDAILVVLVDQWRVEVDALARLTAAWRCDPNRVVAAGYAGTIGVPAVFGRAFFDVLRCASGDAGARSFLRDPAAPVIVIDLPEAEDDVDTLADLHEFVALSEQDD